MRAAERIKRQIQRPVSVGLGLTVFLLFLLCLHLGTGEYPISVPDVVKSLWGVGEEGESFVLYQLRLPRALAALLAGMSLGVAGAVVQGLTRNPLASPGVLGLNAGSAAAVVAVIVLFPDWPSAIRPVVGFFGGWIAVGIVYIVGWRQGTSALRMILVGLGVAALAQAGVTFLLTMGKVQAVTQASIWMAGSVYGVRWEQVIPLIVWFLVLFPCAWTGARHLDVLHLGDEMATGLGVRLEPIRLLLLAVGVGLAGAAVSTAGTVGFIGLMAPHIARRLIGVTHGGLIPVAAGVGGVVALGADWAGRTLFAPLEIPMGAVTAVIGAPYFFWLLFRKVS